jgi:hypothetical protein
VVPIGRVHREAPAEHFDAVRDGRGAVQPGTVLGHQAHQAFAPRRVAPLGAAFVVEKLGHMRDALLATADGGLHTHGDGHMAHHAHAAALAHLHQAFIALGRQVAVGLGEIEAHVGKLFARAAPAFEIAHAVSHQRRVDDRCAVDDGAAYRHRRADQGAGFDAVAHPKGIGAARHDLDSRDAAGQ